MAALVALHEKQTWFCHGNLCHMLRNISSNHSVKTAHKCRCSVCNEEAICKDPEMQPASLDKSSIKMDWGKVENCSAVRLMEILNLLGKCGHCILWTKEDRDHPDQLENIRASGFGSLHSTIKTFNGERNVQDLEHHIFPSRGHLFQRRPCKLW